MRSVLQKGLFITVFATSICLSKSGIAQDNPSGHISFKWGEEYELPKRFEDLGFVGNSTDGYIQIGHRNHETLSFQKFDKNLHFTGENEVDISNLPRDYDNELFTQLGDKYYWFFSTYDKSEDAESLYAQEIDVKSGNVQGKAQRLARTGKLTGTLERTGMFSGKLVGKWNFFFSFDKRKVLIQYRKKAERGDDNRNSTFGLEVFDQNLAKLWSKKVRFPYEERKRTENGGATDFQVDNQGAVYSLVKVEGPNDEGDRRHPGYHLELFRWSQDKPEADKIPFRFTDKFVSDAAVNEDNKGNIIVAGYYSNRRNSSAVNGAFILKLDPGTGQLSNVLKGTYDFPANVLGQFENARTRRKLERKEDRGDDLEEANLALRSIEIQPDGSMLIVGEQSQMTVQRYSNYRTTSLATSQTTTVRYIYNYDDILALKIAADGNMQWITKIPKSQRSVQSGGMYSGYYYPTASYMHYGKLYVGDMGYRSYTFGGDSYFFFVDRESNIELDPEHAPDTHEDQARGMLVAVKLDKDGKMSKEMVYNGREEKVRITPTDFDDVGSNQIIVRGRARRRESQAALITFH